MKIYIGAYKGKSLISKIIKAITWGDFSHVALIRDDGQTIESWHINPATKGLDRYKGKVIESDSPWALHTPDTEITIFELLYPDDFHQIIWNSALKKVGLNYDFIALTGFIPLLRRLWRDDPQKWFCSHQVADDCDIGGRCRLFNKTISHYKLDPSQLAASPWLEPLGDVKNLGEFKRITSATI